MRTKHNRCLYLDCEYQCWDGQQQPQGFTNDIIQIGIVEADLDRLVVTRLSGYLVRPQACQISPFCRELTGIDERDLLTRGRPFSERMASIQKKYGPASKVCLTWGDERRPIDRECLRHKVINPFTFVNLGWLYRSSYGIGHNVGLKDALRDFGMEFEGRQHDAVWDAYNTARVHFALLQRLRKGGEHFDPDIPCSAPSGSTSPHECAVGP